MKPNPDQVLYAHVLLRHESGAPDEDAAITAENIHRYAPSDRVVSIVRAYFENAGFETSGPDGISIAINGSVQLFERFFQSTIYQNEQGYYSIHPEADGDDFELPTRVLGAAVADLVQAITFSPPMDFGPTGSFD